ncbi:MAG: glycosyltransferase family 4 protein [Lactobacillaceae bacterium]|jgi:1,2-diacylglycerol-3-alpha-glucose alpha-1,2-galactosyltransferase|nr:glycosyltransferase family 4 protein [Lactobacillaceae bacterium]
MIKINMFSSAEKVPGQGVASAYRELVNLIQDHLSDKFSVFLNTYRSSDISHYHTIDFTFYLSTFLPNRGRTIGYVHFLPETLVGSLKLPKIIKPIVSWYVLAFYRRMNALVVVNPSFIPDLIDAGIPEEKITYIPNFVNPNNFYELSIKDKKNIRKTHGYDLKKKIVLGVGQVQVRKGIFDFIKLAQRNPEWIFIWVGGFSFGRITDGYEELKKIIKNPPKNLIFPGILPRSELNNYYNIADVFLLPSYSELFPMSALEAFSTHTPTVLRDLELYKFVIDGYYASGADIDELESQLKTLLSNPRIYKQYMQKAIDASIKYSPKNVAKLWEKYYAEQFEKNN